MADKTHPMAGAFPLLVRGQGQHGNEINYGLTKREYFAAMALQGLASSPDPWMPEAAAFKATAFADALIAELNKEGA
jgi:hypothetical protein